jgi:hypothetical protein
MDCDIFVPFRSIRAFRLLANPWSMFPPVVKYQLPGRLGATAMSRGVAIPSFGVIFN